MSREVTIQEQIRESMRGPRIIGDFPSTFSLSFTKTDLFTNLFEPKQPEARMPHILPIENWVYIPTDPFSLSYREFQSMELNEAEELLRKVHNLCKDMLEESWRRGVRQAVVCNGKIVFESTDIDDIPNETVESLARKYDKACYVFSAPDLVEESSWTSIVGDDFYPTICLYLGTEDSNEKEIVENTSPIYADLDTGNPFYKIFDANQLVEQLTDFTPLQMRRGEHLGRSYTYFRKKVRMCVRDIHGNINSTVCSVRLVKNWIGCAVLQVSPNRTGFVGRDVLRDLRIRLKLDPIKKTTQILDVSS